MECSVVREIKKARCWEARSAAVEALGPDPSSSFHSVNVCGVCMDVLVPVDPCDLKVINFNHCKVCN